MSGYELTEFEWRVIEPLLPKKPRGVPSVDYPRVLNGNILDIPLRLTVAEFAGMLRSLHDMLYQPALITTHVPIYDDRWPMADGRWS